MISHMKLNKSHIHMTDEEFSAAVDKSYLAVMYADALFLAIEEGHIPSEMILFFIKGMPKQMRDQFILRFVSNIGGVSDE